jgi:transposase
MELNYPTRWQKPRVDLRELANLRYVHKYSRKQLASHFGRSEEAIQNYFQKIKKIVI